MILEDEDADTFIAYSERELTEAEIKSLEECHKLYLRGVMR